MNPEQQAPSKFCTKQLRWAARAYVGAAIGCAVLFGSFAAALNQPMTLLGAAPAIGVLAALAVLFRARAHRQQTLLGAYSETT
ncbi:MAG: hypothetical protein CSA58_00425 [Micrococcales bacterium]|nr:MAG: hypothetical protein CSB46_03350 [Micrococcales bacterium]PIE28171.1 MAG: hypothetical protein CSA58_00425 [Micrococcales bacterium]